MTTEAPDPTVNRFERRRLQNRAALLEAAIGLFRKKGVRDTTIEEICERADVSRRTFFNHFETRDHLFLAISEVRTAEFAALIDEVGCSAAPFAERLCQFLGRLGAAFAEMPAYRELVARMIGLGMERGLELNRGGRLGDAIHRFVAVGVERGEIGSPHPPQVLADVLLGTLLIAITNWCANEEFDPEVELAASAGALVDLFQPRDSAAE